MIHDWRAERRRAHVMQVEAHMRAQLSLMLRTYLLYAHVGLNSIVPVVGDVIGKQLANSSADVRREFRARLLESFDAALGDQSEGHPD